MTVQINYKNSASKITSGNLILFVNDKYEIEGFEKYISKSEQLYMSDLLKISDLKKRKVVEDCAVIVPKRTHYRRVIEIISPEYLRGYFNAEDDSEFCVNVKLNVRN